MNIKTKHIIYLVLISFLYNCTKEEFEGPSIENLYGEFEIIKSLKITNKNPNFLNNEKQLFNIFL